MISLFIIALCPLIGFAQQVGYSPRDTTYSIYSSYLKIEKTHPGVHPVWSALPKSIQVKSNVVYANLNGKRPLHLDVFHPKRKNKKKRPGILMIHGGGWTTGSKENLIPMAQQLAKRGYVTVTVEYRLSGEAPYPAAVHDLKAAVRWMRANAIEIGIDTNRIAAYGCSAGAHLAALLGATNKISLFDSHPENASSSAEVQAILSIDGIVSFIHPEAKPEWTGRSANAWLSKKEQNYERWREASPLEYAGNNTPPILFVNSSFPRFHAGRDDLLSILNEHGTYSEVHTFEGSPHSFWLLDPWFEPTLKYSVRFLRKIFK